jgi:hypothetical protein
MEDELKDEQPVEEQDGAELESLFAPVVAPEVAPEEPAPARHVVRCQVCGAANIIEG